VISKRGKGQRPCSSEWSKHAAQRDKYNWCTT